jgi:hypothetical protein
MKKDLFECHTIDEWAAREYGEAYTDFYATAEKMIDRGWCKQEWISVEERLPECEPGAETEALLFRLSTGTVIAGYFGRGGIWRDKYFRHYWDDKEGWDAADVTHWMPLPAPPNGGDGK